MNSIDRVIDWPCGLHLGMRITPVSYFRRRDHRGGWLTQRDSRFMPMNTVSREDATRIADTITGIQPVERTQRRSSRIAARLAVRRRVGGGSCRGDAIAGVTA